MDTIQTHKVPPYGTDTHKQYLALEELKRRTHTVQIHEYTHTQTLNKVQMHTHNTLPSRSSGDAPPPVNTKRETGSERGSKREREREREKAHQQV